MPNCELGHHGEDVSFNSILKKYNLADPALVLLGELVRAADSRPSNPHPAGEGLRWVANGFSTWGFTTTKFWPASSSFMMRSMRSASGA